MGYQGGMTPSTTSIYVCNLPSGTDATLLAEHFGTIGLLKKDKRTGQPKIWIYKDKVTAVPKGDATITYEDPHAAAAAVDWFNNTDFHGNTISVSIAETKNKEPTGQAFRLQTIPPQMVTNADSLMGGDFSMVGGNINDNLTEAGGRGRGRGRGRGETVAKAWQQEGDWLCPNPSCSNVNFAFRGVCNRCGTARPAGSLSAGGSGGGGGRGRGSGDMGSKGRGIGGPPGLFGPNDWPCPMCGNINWAKRAKCNVCNTTKPGHNEGDIRGGRAGGYKEYDEAEIEETRRRRREAEEDDGEMYDEFGNLKKKFRMKAKQNEAGHVASLGKAGWDDEELGVVEREKSREKSKERVTDHQDWDKGRDIDTTGYTGHSYSREHDDYGKGNGHDKRGHGRYDYERVHNLGQNHDGYHERERCREREREKGRGGNSDRDRDREYDYDRSRDKSCDYMRDRDTEHTRERHSNQDRSY